MSRKQYKTARGKRFDMGEFAHANEKKRAVGNMNVNAKGDVLGQGGHIKKTREEVVHDFYHEGPPQEAEVSLKKETIPVEDALTTMAEKEKNYGPVDTFVSPEEAIQTLLDQQAGTREKAEMPAKRGKAKTGKVKDMGIKGGAEYAGLEKENE